MDAVCHAEHVREVEWLEQFHKKGLIERLRNEEGRHKELQEIKLQCFAAEQAAHDKAKRLARSERLNTARHAKGNHAKDLVCKEWDKKRSKYKSFEKAGADLSDWAVNERLLEKLEPRTACGWIREYAKTINFKYR
jgi:hypothetical protein